MRLRVVDWLRGAVVIVPIAALIVLAGGMLVVAVADWLLNRPPDVFEAKLVPRALGIGLGAGVAAVVLAAVLWRAFGRERQVRIGIAVGAGIVTGLVLVIGMFALLIVVTGESGQRDEPQSYSAAVMTIALFVLASVVVVVGAVWVLLRLIAQARINHPIITGLFWVVATGFVLAAIEEAPEPAEVEGDEAVLTGDVDGRHDVMLMVDPADPAARRLTRLAAQDPALKDLRADAVHWDTAYGVAVVGDGDGERVRVVLQPTRGRKAVADALTRLADDETPAPAGVHEAALERLALPEGVRWREGAGHAVAWIVAEPPEREAVARPAALHAFAAPGAVAPGTTRVHLIVDRASADARERWADAVASTGGTIDVPRADDGRDALARAEDAATGVAAASDEYDLAFRHRPILEFNSGESRRPLDADAFLEETAPDGEPSHQLCRNGRLGPTDCRGVTTARDLLSDIHDPEMLLALDVNPTGQKDADRPQRMYFHVAGKRGDERIHLDYWIFYRFNDAPRFPRHTCLSGFSIKELTCFDHEGDWEGVTVTLRRKRGEKVAYEPESVAYAGHTWPSYRFSWPRLMRVGATRDERPRVWVAKGSHASYPAPCGPGSGPRGGRLSCEQPETAIPDGRRDGKQDWELNDDGACRAKTCLLALPMAGRVPATWNAFAGRWGVPRCTLGTRLCVRSLGPETPWYQGRFEDPGGQRVNDRLLDRLHGLRGAQ
jgi:hypothetical protein